MTLSEIKLWGTTIGTIAFDPNTGIGAFEYDADFLDSGIEISPITMPLSSRVYTFPELSRISFHGLPGLLADSLPDAYGNAVINAWLQSQGRTPESFNPVERLCYTGSRGMGALEFAPAYGPRSTKSESIAIDKLVELASDVLRNREDIHVVMGDTAMQEIIQVSSSAGGARAKAVIAWNETTGDIRSGQIKVPEGYGHWLIKFDGVDKNGDKEGDDPKQYTNIEYAYHLMARDAGVIMQECRLFEESGRYHFMTRRFDRDLTTGGKFHMLSLGGMAHYDYNQPGAHSYEQASRIMRQLHLGHQEILQLYLRMVFNVLVRNHDDHVKNISFLMNRDGDWSLAPAYDITYSYNPDGMWTGTHQMRINGKQDNITRDDLWATAKSMGIKKSEAKKAIEQVQASQMKWMTFAESAKIDENIATNIALQFVKI